MGTNGDFYFFMKQDTTFSARPFIASCVTSSRIIVWKGHSSLYSKHQFHKNKVFRRRNPFSSDELGADVRQRCSCFPTVLFLSKPWIGFYEADHAERHYGGSLQCLEELFLPHPLSCRLTYLSAVYICSRSVFSTSAWTLHLFSLFPPGKFVLDVGSVPAKNSTHHH